MKKILYIHDNSRIIDYECLCENFEVVNGLDYKEGDLRDIDFVIQDCDIRKWDRYGSMHHIGYLNEIPEDYYASFNMVDEIWAPTIGITNFASKILKGNVNYLPHATDVNIYNKSYNFQDIPEINGTFSFLFTSSNKEDCRRVLRAFWKRFDPTEPVSLILNSSVMSTADFNTVKEELNLYNNNVYQKFILIDTKFTNEQSLAISQLIDCYITTEKYWDNGLMHANGFNKGIISLETISNSMLSAYETRHMPIYSNQDRFSKNKFIKSVRSILECS